MTNSLISLHPWAFKGPSLKSFLCAALGRRPPIVVHGSIHFAKFEVARAGVFFRVFDGSVPLANLKCKVAAAWWQLSVLAAYPCRDEDSRFGQNVRRAIPCHQHGMTALGLLAQPVSKS